MKLDVPRVISVMPTAKEVKEQYGISGFQLKLWMKIAKTVHLRTKLAEAQNWKCCYCGCKMNTLVNNKRAVTVEHVIPRSKGGADTWENTVAACAKCNHSRGNTELKSDGTITMTEIPDVSLNERRKAKKLEDYKIRAEKLSINNFAVNHFVQTAHDWFKTIKLDCKEKTLLKEFMKEKGWM